MLQAIFEYQTAICELTGMDVSNASGYDGTTVAADACFVAKHATGRTLIVVTEATNPQVRPGREDLRAGFGLEVVEVPHEGGVTDPDRVREAAAGAAAVIFQHPNFFGCLEPAAELTAAANEGGALPVAHVDLVSLGVLEPPGVYGCALAIGEGQSAGNAMSYGGPHYGFLAARGDLVRRLPGRIVGETVDVAGDRGYVLTLQTREQHIRREKATSNITTNQTLLALAGLVHLSLLGPQGLRELGETCLGVDRLREVASRRRSGSSWRSRSGTRSRSSSCGRVATHARRCRRRARTASIPATRSGATTRDSTTRCSSRSPRSGPSPRSIVWRRRSDREADLREVADRPARPAGSEARPAGAGAPRGAAAVDPPRLPELAEPEVLRHFTALSTRNYGIDTGFYPLGSCTMKYNPRINERLVGLPGFAGLHPLVEDDAAQGALELEWELQEILRELTGLDAVSLSLPRAARGSSPA